MQPIDDDGLRAADLPAGAPSPAGWERHGLAHLDPTPLKPATVVRLTAAGSALRHAYLPRLEAIEQRRWRTEHGAYRVDALRHGLETVVADAHLERLPPVPLVTWIGGLQVR